MICARYFPSEETLKSWSKEYYERKERKNLEMVQCWCFAILLGVAIVAAGAAIVGGYALARWLIGGA